MVFQCIRSGECFLTNVALIWPGFVFRIDGGGLTYVDFGHSPIISSDHKFGSTAFCLAHEVTPTIGFPLAGFGVESYSTVDENLADSTLASLTFFHINKSKVLIFLIFLIKTDLGFHAIAKIKLLAVCQFIIQSGGGLLIVLSHLSYFWSESENIM